VPARSRYKCSVGAASHHNIQALETQQLSTRGMSKLNSVRLHTTPKDVGTADVRSCQLHQLNNIK
jgi:hypothetical protein